MVYEEVSSCVTSVEGLRLQQQEGEMQACLDPPLTYVPWITINGASITVLGWREMCFDG